MKGYGTGPYGWSSSSRQVLEELHPDLRRILEVVILYYDVKLLEGIRSKEEQNRLADMDPPRTTLRWPDSNHNVEEPGDLSTAVDLAPYPVDWDDSPLARARFYHLQGYILRVADELGIDVRWGGDWDSDGDFEDQSFHDLPHLELVNPRPVT